MQVFGQSCDAWYGITNAWMITLERLLRVHSEMQEERKRKKKTPCTMERTPGMVGNEQYDFEH